MARNQHNSQDRVIVTDPLKIKFLHLIRGMSPQETAALGELIRAMVDHKSDDVIREASLRVAHAMGISETDTAEVTDRFMQRLADGPSPAPTVVARDQERLRPSDGGSPPADEPSSAPTVVAKDRERLCPSDRLSPPSRRRWLPI